MLYDFAPSFVSKIGSWVIHDFECYEAMVDTFDCFKPKEVGHPSRETDLFANCTASDIADFWRNKWAKYMCLDSVIDLDIGVLSSSVLVESLPPNLEKLTVSLFCLWIQDEGGIEKLK